MAQNASANSTATPFLLRLMPKYFYPLVEEPLCNPRLWLGLAWIDVVQSYRRTILGPFWITFNLLIFVGAMTLVYGALFSVSSIEYTGYLTTGMMAWFWVAALLNEVGNTFINYSPFIKGSTMPKSVFIWATVCKQVIVFCHHAIVYVCLILIGIIPLTVYTLFAIPAVLVLFLISVPITAMASILFARYRDLPRLISSGIVVLLMVTPIFWKPAMIGGWRSLLVHLNPIYYFVEFIRLPLLGIPETPIILFVNLGMLLLLWSVGAAIYRRYEKYVVFWL